MISFQGIGTDDFYSTSLHCQTRDSRVERTLKAILQCYFSYSDRKPGLVTIFDPFSARLLTRKVRTWEYLNTSKVQRVLSDVMRAWFDIFYQM